MSDESLNQIERIRLSQAVPGYLELCSQEYGSLRKASIAKIREKSEDIGDLTEPLWLAFQENNKFADVTNFSVVSIF